MIKSLLCLLTLLPSVALADGSGSLFRFEPLTPLPAAIGSRPVAGMVDGELLVCGNAAYRLKGRQWQPVSAVSSRPMAVATAKEGLYCVDANGRSVYRLDGKLTRTELPELPSTLMSAAIAVGDGGLYVAGPNGFWRLNLRQNPPRWQELPAKPTRSPALAWLAGTVYLFGGEGQAFAYQLRSGWKPLAASPVSLANASPVAVGQAHILLLGADGAPHRILAYHTITDRWVDLGEVPLSETPVVAAASLSGFVLLGATAGVVAEAILPSTKYGWLDHAVVAIYFVGMLLVGVVLAKREKGENDFFRGGQRIPWWASGLSLFATGASAISLMAMPAKAYAENWIYFSAGLFSLFFLPLGLLIYVPIARRLRVATANEYLERRFNLTLRIFSAVCFSLTQILCRFAAIMILPAIAMSTMAGIPMTTSILTMGVITTLYAALGGFEAVIWTDVIQSFIMLGTILLLFIGALLALHTDVGTAWSLLQSQDKLRLTDWSFDISQPIVYLMFVGPILGLMGCIGDQNFIQRVQCTADERQSKKAVMTQLLVAVPLNFILFGLGTLLFLYYRERPQVLSPAMKTDGIMPFFAGQSMPIGVAGLVMTALLAATMSTISGAINSVANIGVADFYRRFLSAATDRGAMILSRVLTFLLGATGTGVALLMVKSGQRSIWDLSILIAGIIGSPMIAVFTLGVFTRRANSKGVMVGVLVGIATSVYVHFNFRVTPFLFGLIGFAISFAVGYLASLLMPEKPRDLTGLTAYSLQKEEVNR